MAIEGWEARSYATIMDGVVIRWRPSPWSWADCPQVNASRNGVGINGAWPIMRVDQMDRFREVLDLAQDTYRRLQSGDECDDFERASFGEVTEDKQP